MNPLSAIFGAGVAIRNAFYDRRIFQVNKLARPVVSIGNISVGGSGKTPFVIALGQLLAERGITFDVLSRGYGRSSTGIAVVDPGGSPIQFGDEPLLIAQKLQAPVIVGADRYQAGLFAEKKFAGKLHLLDDGFQHRRLHRDFDIVLLPKEDQAGSLLPAGRLREAISALRRADAVILFDSQRPPIEAKRTWQARREIELPVAAGKIIVFSGIARPQQFLAGLQSSKLEIAGAVTFRDHHRYQQRDIDRLLQLKKQTGADGFITTEKDLMNLGPLSSQLSPLLTAGLRIEIESVQQVVIEMIKTIQQRSGQQIQAPA
ncbi:MAG TPA: tetraacyldisaccharide 4'-kinase [Candidatus Angelobacter sp.]|jgi:tetraacyldisaccharide 4'-kinase|nr:tetraacyldisaccharide 4'-kinase [Candidatus Angelobacter sp.]